MCYIVIKSENDSFIHARKSTFVEAVQRAEQLLKEKNHQVLYVYKEIKDDKKIFCCKIQ